MGKVLLSQWLVLMVAVALSAALAGAQNQDRERFEEGAPPQEFQRDRDRERGEEPEEQRDRDEEPQDQQGRPREGGIPRGQVVTPDGEAEEEGSVEGLPELRGAPDDRRVAPLLIPPDRRRWRLGVFAYNTDTGVVITRVVPGSAALHAGLERGDRIVAVDGFQIGWVTDRLYPLGEELQRRAGRRGDVLLLVQNVRNQRLVNVDVELDRAARVR